MKTYSFQDVVAAIVGPGGSISLGNGAGAAEEGISIESIEDTDTMSIGADGSVMHNLHASKAGKITVRLLKTSPTNGALMAMYNYQRISAARHGINTMTIADIARGENVTAVDVAFAKAPGIGYGKDGATMEWEFNAGKIDYLLAS